MPALGDRAPFAQVQQDWAAIYSGPGSCTDYAHAVAVDTAENVYVTGESYLGPFRGYDIATLKYNPAGEQQWVAFYNDFDYDVGSAMALDSAGNVYVTGVSDAIGPGSNYDFATICYNPDGQQQWAQRYNGPGNSGDWPRDIAVDREGNVLVTGESCDPYWIRLNYDYCTIKYSVGGQQLWVARYDGIGHDDDKPCDLAVDDEGNAYVTGYSDADSAYSEENYDWVTVKYNSSGQEQWVARYSTIYEEKANALAVDDSGNVYVSGYRYTPQSHWDFLTIKYDAQGQEVWTVSFDESNTDRAFAIALDEENNICVAGRSGQNYYNYITTIRYSPEGEQQWLAQHDAGLAGIPRADIKTDALGNIYVVSDVYGWGFETNWVTLKYSDLGVEQWALVFDGSPLANQDGDAHLALGPNREVVVSGSSAHEGVENINFATVKYSQANWIQINLEPAAPPIQIPATGGNFQYYATLTNDTTVAQRFDLWVMVRLPDLSWYGPVLGPFELTLPGSASITRLRRQTMPGGAPAGAYIYEGRLGDYPDEIWEYDNFSFEKLSAGEGIVVENWDNQGESFEAWSVIAADQKPAEPVALGVYPNPFNAAIAISFELPVASHVKLGVFDLSGRMVGMLVNGWREAGAHEVTFDGSGLAAGVYVARLQGGEFTAVQKLVLMK